jgi:hypothetical protein
MPEIKTCSIAALTLVLLFSCPAIAGTVWDESVNGDLSNNPLAPTSLIFAPGSNDVIGSAGGAPGPGALAPFDQDFFTFTIPAGNKLLSLTAVTVKFSDPTDMFAFIGIQNGLQITHSVSPPSFGGDASGLLGWLHVATSNQHANILPAMGVGGDKATGFLGPLPAGQYSVWVQDDLPLSYDFSFQVGVPEPSTWVTMFLGFVGLGLAARRKRVGFQA